MDHLEQVKSIYRRICESESYPTELFRCNAVCAAKVLEDIEHTLREKHKLACPYVTMVYKGTVREFYTIEKNLFCSEILFAVETFGKAQIIPWGEIESKVLREKIVCIPIATNFSLVKGYITPETKDPWEPKNMLEFLY